MKKDRENPVDMIHLKYDLTPQKFLSMIVCEVGNIPPHSVPVVIREIMADNDDLEDDWKRASSRRDDSDSDSNLSVDMELNQEIAEAAGEDESDDDVQRIQVQRDGDKKKRIAEAQKRMQQLQV